MGFRVVFPSTKNVMNHNQIMPSCKPNPGVVTLPTNENSRILKRYGTNNSHVNQCCTCICPAHGYVKGYVHVFVIPGHWMCLPTLNLNIN